MKVDFSLFFQTEIWDCLFIVKKKRQILYVFNKKMLN